MPVFRINNKNVVFIHVPKTGGTSVETTLAQFSPMGLHSRMGHQLKAVNDGIFTRAIPLQHFHGGLLEACLDPGLVDYAFMIVRSPAQRLISEYRHCRARMKRLDARLPFSAWLRLSLRIAKLEPGYRNNHFRPQVEFRCFNAEVFRFEDGLQPAMQKIASRIGLGPIDVPHARQSPSVPVELTPKDRAYIAKTYAADYEVFGYEPGY